MLNMRELRNSPNNMAIDTGPLLLPLTREPGWDKIMKLLNLHEKGEVVLRVGLFNISELAHAMHRLGYDVDTSLRYAILVSEKLDVIGNLRYAIWMSRLRIGAYELRYKIPWGDISSATVAHLMDIPVIALDEDRHFNQIMTICNKLGKPIQVIRVRDLEG